MGHEVEIRPYRAFFFDLNQVLQQGVHVVDQVPLEVADRLLGIDNLINFLLIKAITPLGIFRDHPEPASHNS